MWVKMSLELMSILKRWKIYLWSYTTLKMSAVKFRQCLHVTFTMRLTKKYNPLTYGKRSGLVTISYPSSLINLLSPLTFERLGRNILMKLVLLYMYDMTQLWKQFCNLLHEKPDAPHCAITTAELSGWSPHTTLKIVFQYSSIWIFNTDHIQYNNENFI